MSSALLRAITSSDARPTVFQIANGWTGLRLESNLRTRASLPQIMDSRSPEEGFYDMLKRISTVCESQALRPIESIIYREIPGPCYWPCDCCCSSPDCPEQASRIKLSRRRSGQCPYPPDWRGREQFQFLLFLISTKTSSLRSEDVMERRNPVCDIEAIHPHDGGISQPGDSLLCILLRVPNVAN